MAISEKKRRVQVTLPAELVQKIDTICEKAAITRNVWIQYTLGMAADSYEGLTEAAARIALEAGSKEEGTA